MKHEYALGTAELSPAIAASPDFSGRWRNQMGSFMDLVVADDIVSGTYNSANSAGGPPVTGAIKGSVIDDLITFSVTWQRSGSITAWTGQLVQDGAAPKIRTLWHLVTNIPDGDEPTKLWMSTYAGADEFLR